MIDTHCHIAGDEFAGDLNDVVARAPQDGRLEAVDTSEWFGFRDDIVVRLRSEGDGTRIDIRSKSRVGQSDLGVNAKRIRAFLADVKAEN